MVVAGTGWGGAALAVPAPLPWVGLLLGSALVARRSGRGRLAVVGLALAAGLAASALAADAWDGLSAPIPSRLEGRVMLTADPRPTRFGIRVEVRADGRLWDVVADGSAAGVLRSLRAGETVLLAATTAARVEDDLWRASRHVVGIATAERATDPERAGGPWRLANAIHRALLRSSGHLPAEVRGVALGVALGDRGGIEDLLAEDLRAAGLSHLTAVSGQHVVLLIGMLGPLLARLPPRGAALATLIVLAGFVILTRAEPSVLRAAGMAALVTVAQAGGRRVGGLRVLAVAVTALVLVDPLLVWSIGFQLSVAATVGIAVGARRLAALLPGPRAVAAALGISLAAQIAVAPLVIAHFGVMPLVGVVANLAVVPVIGPLLGWTLAAGVVAGALPGLAPFAHVPTALMAGWIVRVAEWSSAVGVPGLHLRGLILLGVVALALGGLVLVLRRRRSSHRVVLNVLGLVLVAAALGVAVTAGGGAMAGRHALGAGAEAIVGRDGVILILDGRASPAQVVGGLRRIGAGGVDVVLVRTASPAVGAVVEAVRQRFGASTVLVPRGSSVSGAVPVDDGWEAVVGVNRVVARPGGDGRLDVAVIDPV